MMVALQQTWMNGQNKAAILGFQGQIVNQYQP